MVDQVNDTERMILDSLENVLNLHARDLGTGPQVSREYAADLVSLLIESLAVFSAISLIRWCFSYEVDEDSDAYKFPDTLADDVRQRTRDIVDKHIVEHFNKDPVYSTEAVDKAKDTVDKIIADMLKGGKE